MTRFVNRAYALKRRRVGDGEGSGGRGELSLSSCDSVHIWSWRAQVFAVKILSRSFNSHTLLMRWCGEDKARNVEDVQLYFRVLNRTFSTGSIALLRTL